MSDSLDKRSADEPNPSISEAPAPSAAADEIPGQEALLEVQQAMQAWAGPMPPPGALGHYDAVLPGAAERIMSMAEQSLKHKIDQENKGLDASIVTAKRGQWMAIGLAVSCLALAAAFFAMGYPVAGVAFLSLPSILLVRSFLKRE